jgi:hypothetical protein
MPGQRVLPGRGVRLGQQQADLGQRHVEAAQPADEVRVAGLVGRVPPVPGGLVDRVGHQQLDIVVIPQRFGAEVAQPGEFADRDSVCHATQ